MRHTRYRSAGLVLGILTGCFLVLGCEDAGRPGTATTKPSAETGDAREARWLASWARGDKGRRPKWAGGQVVLSWPRDVADDLMQSWAKEKGLAGLSEEEIRTRLGRPLKVLTNVSVDCRLLLYRDGCVQIVGDKCGGWAPRSPNFEKYSLQPDL